MKRRSWLVRGTAALAVAAFCAGGLAGCAPQRPPAPPKPLAPPPPPAVPKKEKIVLRQVHFGFDSYHIRPGDAAILDEAAATLSKHPDVTVYVDGYCDSRGGVKYNLRLSERRAKAVARYLEHEGIPASRLIPRGFGKTHFVAPNDTDEGRAQNRRVELVPIQ
jgi:outer membrane protein OmpA-like peptidoglycan-associated protein